MGVIWNENRNQIVRMMRGQPLSKCTIWCISLWFLNYSNVSHTLQILPNQETKPPSMWETPTEIQTVTNEPNLITNRQ